MSEQFSMDLPSDVLALLEILNKNGYEAYVVGGCVRDALLNKKPHDYDICTSATPSQIKEAFRLAGYKTYDTGIKHGTISVNNNDELYEITTFRIDGKYSDGRHPDNVTFTTNLIDDLSRRDFTINAMAYNNKVGLVDPFGGKKDLENKTLKCVGNPADRFKEDALRILRAARLVSRYGFGFDIPTLKAMEESKTLLDLIASERIQSEFSQFLLSASPDVLDECRGIIAQFLPEVESTFEFPEDMYCHVKSLWRITIETIDLLCEDIILRLTAMFQNIGRPSTYTIQNGIPCFPGYCEKTVEMTDAALTRLKFDNTTKRNVLDILKYQDKPITKDPAVLKAVMNKIGVENTTRLVRLLTANTLAYKKVRTRDGRSEEEFNKETQQIDEKIRKLYQTDSKICEIVANGECYRLKDLVVNGNDIISIGIPEEKDVGIVLNALLKDVLKHPEHNSKKFLMDRAEKEIERLELSRTENFSLF